MSTASNSRSSSARRTPAGELAVSTRKPSSLSRSRKASSTSPWSSATRTAAPFSFMVPMVTPALLLPEHRDGIGAARAPGGDEGGRRPHEDQSQDRRREGRRIGAPHPVEEGREKASQEERGHDSEHAAE